MGYVYLVTQTEPETAWRYAATTATLDQMGDAAAESGAAEVRLNVWAFNDEARAFYRRCGFVAVQERLWLSTGIVPPS